MEPAGLSKNNDLQSRAMLEHMVPDYYRQFTRIAGAQVEALEGLPGVRNDVVKQFDVYDHCQSSRGGL